MRARRTAPVVLEGEHLLAAGLVEGVEERGAAAGTELADALVEEIDVVGEVLRDVGLDVEALDEGAVVEVQDLEEELDGGVLLELEALADGAGGVEHDADAQGQIGLLVEAEDSDGRTAVVEQAEVLALEAGDEAALLVGDGEDEIDFVDLDLDGGDGLVLAAVGCCRRAAAGAADAAEALLALGAVCGGLRGAAGCGLVRRGGAERRSVRGLRRRGRRRAEERKAVSQERRLIRVKHGHWTILLEFEGELAANCCEKRLEFDREGSFEVA